MMKGRFAASVTMSANVRTALQPAYVLHSRAYRDSSLLVEVFTAEQGLISLVARGARRVGKRGTNAALLQPFRPVLISFSGRSELRSLTRVEAAGSSFSLHGERLFSGLYVNELLLRLLHRHDPHPELFARYGEVLAELVSGSAIEEHLRKFELALLDDLGYQLALTEDRARGKPVNADAWYRYMPGQGLSEVPDASGITDKGAAGLYRGVHLLSMSQGSFSGEVRRVAKGLLREVLAEHLGGRPLRSRELFQKRMQGVPGSGNARNNG